MKIDLQTLSIVVSGVSLIATLTLYSVNYSPLACFAT